MRHPATHERQHPTWGDRWNPYRQRDTRTHILDKATFDALCCWNAKEFISPELFMTGCLDAPDELPLGATASIRTIGGFYREEYLRLGREWESWASYIRASNETAVMLKGILEETA